MKKQRKETRLKRKRLKAAYNTILEENRRLKGFGNRCMAEKRLEHLENAKYSQYLKQEVTIWEKS